MDFAAVCPCADGVGVDVDAELAEHGWQFAGFAFFAAGEQLFAGGAAEHGCGPRVVAMLAAGFFGVGCGVDGLCAVGVEAVADVDAGFVHDGDGGS